MAAVTIPAHNFKSNDPRKVGRTLALVRCLQEGSVKFNGPAAQAARMMRERIGSFDGPVYWTLAARLLGAN